VYGPIYTELAPIRRRQQRLLALRLALAGLLAGSLLGVVLGLGRWLAGWSISPGLAAGVLLAGPALGAAAAFLRRPRWEEAAAAVDAHFQLKDCTVTALQFLTTPEPTGFHEMQVRDAVRRLRGVEPSSAVPFWLPRAWPVTLGLFLAAVGLLAWPLGSQPAAASAEALQTILNEADFIDESLDRLEDLAVLCEDKELARLVEELRKKVEEMRQPGVDLREALAKISEMQAALQAQAARYSVPLVDAQLKDLGAALSAAGSLQETGKLLREGQYEKAADQLDKVEEPKADPKEAKSLQEKLKQVARNMKGAKLERLSEATGRMADGARGDRSQYKQGARDLAKEVRDHARRRRINQLLALERERLSECKNRCQQNTLSWLRQQNAAKEKKSSGGAGTAAGGKDFGERTDLQAQRKRDRVEGQESAGPSEVETEMVPDARQQAQRAYREMYQKYRRLSDTALESEPIPLRQRRVIRRYFELIHPPDGGGEK
jgi:hypothetical protein